MAALKTKVSSPIGPIAEISGRVPRHEAIRDVANMLRKEIRDKQAHLDELDNWTTTASRGELKARTYEEMEW